VARLDHVGDRVVRVVPKQVNIYEAKSQFSRLVEEVEAGAEILIARNGRPVARLVPLKQLPELPADQRPTNRLFRLGAAALPTPNSSQSCSPPAPATTTSSPTHNNYYTRSAASPDSPNATQNTSSKSTA
jgi:prevent-host-death family protein